MLPVADPAGDQSANDVVDPNIGGLIGMGSTFEEDFFSGVVTLTSDGDPRLKLIPYYLYANRGKGWMRVWMPRE